MFQNSENLCLARRGLFGLGGKLTLSAAAAALLAGSTNIAGATSTTAEDLGVLNAALGLEYQGIAAYQLGAESGLLKKPVLKVALQFQSDHKMHAEALSSAIVKAGGTPVTAQKLSQYNFPADKLKSQADVLKFASNLEREAVSAYLGAVSALANRDLAKAAASILGNEAQHWSLLLNALGENPVPSPFMS
jgi:hypothetical protein